MVKQFARREDVVLLPLAGTEDQEWPAPTDRPISDEKLAWIELNLFGEERVAALRALAEVILDTEEAQE